MQSQRGVWSLISSEMSTKRERVVGIGDGVWGWGLGGGGGVVQSIRGSERRGIYKQRKTMVTNNLTI